MPSLTESRVGRESGEARAVIIVRRGARTRAKDDMYKIDCVNAGF
jgi:hypothetical protein